MPDDFGATLPATDHRDRLSRDVQWMVEVVNRVEDLATEVGPSPCWNVRDQPGPEHDVRGVEDAVLEPDREGVIAQGDLEHLGAKFDIGQTAGDPPKVLIEFHAAHPRLQSVDEAVHAILGVKEGKERIWTCGIDKRDEVLQIRNLDGGLGKEESGMPLEVRASLE